MNYSNEAVLTETINNIENHLPNIGIDKVKKEIIDGLKSSPKYISPKFFYNSKGSELFEEITELEEYYPTRTEKSILSSIIEKLVIDFESLSIIELGSGDSSKIKLLLNQISPTHLSTLTYYPFDISQSAIEKASLDLRIEFPSISINGIVADFIHQIDRVPKVGNRLFCFLGSTIGNFRRREVKEFMIELGSVMKKGDSFILGMDMVKDVSILEDAYNDSKGITEQFNKNILNVANELADLDFIPNKFNHIAFYNWDEQRIEMHLEASENCEVLIDGGIDKISFEKGETIHTENSHKFSSKDIETIGRWAGLKIEQIVTDKMEWFSLVHYRKTI